MQNQATQRTKPHSIAIKEPLSTPKTPPDDVTQPWEFKKRQKTETDLLPPNCNQRAYTGPESEVLTPEDSVDAVWPRV